MDKPHGPGFPGHRREEREPLGRGLSLDPQRRSFAAGLTIVELLQLALERAGDERVEAGRGGYGEEAREFALAVTSIEDAIMRTNRGFANRRYSRLGGGLVTSDVELDLRKEA